VGLPAVARLLVVSPHAAPAVYPLQAPCVSVGRGEDNTIVLPSPFVSRHHAEFLAQEGGHIVRDLHSRNGTSLNGHRLAQPTRLQPGDVVTICGYTLTYQTGEDTVALVAPSTVVVDPARAAAWVDGARVELSALELRLLTLLERRAGTVVTKDEIAAYLWPSEQGDVSDERIEQLISRVRRKLGERRAGPRHLTTIRGVGYRLEQG